MPQDQPKKVHPLFLRLRNRRNFLGWTGVFLLGAGGVEVYGATANTAAIVQPELPDHEAFVARAFEMRALAVEKGDQPYGAIVVRDNRIIGQSWSRVIIDNDPTAHAEMAAIRNAANLQEDRSLRGAILYSSSRPCPMCEAAAYWAGIGSMIYGREGVDGGKPTLCR